MAGKIMWQGPHQSAQKYTMTNPLLLSTSPSKFSSVSVMHTMFLSSV